MTEHPLTDAAVWQEFQQALVMMAREQLLPRFRQVDYALKADGSRVTEADLSMQAATEAWLRSRWPQYALLGEEDDEAQQQAALAHPAGCWILDPLDGTSNFAGGMPFFSVSLALLSGGRVVAGAVYDPLRDELFSARLGMGAELNGQPLAALSGDGVQLSGSLAIVDFKRLGARLAGALATASPCLSLRSLGSVALEWCWLADGRGQVYLHGAQSLWDYAAGGLIFHEAQGTSCSLDGAPVFSRRLGKCSAVAAASAELLQEWKAWIDRHA